MLRLTLILSLLAAPVLAQDAGADARAAARALEEASAQLDRATGARDRVRALTATVKAYEAGLAAMRVGLRDAAIRETELSRRLQGQEAEIAQLLGVLSSMGGRAAPAPCCTPTAPSGRRGPA